jgi:hypothetical protein
MSKLPRRPEFNHAIGVLGRVNAGKTTQACKRILQFRREHACYVIIHDARHAIPDRLHDGTRLDVRRYPNVAAMAKGVHAFPKAWHVCTEIDGAGTLRFAKQLALASMKHADPKGLAAPCAPVVVYIDEVTNVEGMKEGKLGEDARDALLLRRHNHVALMWGSQNPMRVHYDLLSDCTELHVARLVKQRDLKRLDEDADLSDEEIARVRALPEHSFHVHRP